jgi:hypothetical protein
MRRFVAGVAAVGVGGLGVVGCGSSGGHAAPSAAPIATVATTVPETTTDPTSTTVAPTTTTIAAPPTTAGLPAFTDTVSGPLVPADVPFTWRPGCPVPPSDLREIDLTYYGFDGAAHTGTIIVNGAVVTGVVEVFQTLYNDRFPIRGMVPEDEFHGSDPDSMAADNTSGFNCRLAVASGPPTWSMHAYGDAIDVNPVENPYFEPGVAVQPPDGAAYANRSDPRPGMAISGGLLVNAFYGIGWGWGGNWAGPDYQHFSTNGR